MSRVAWITGAGGLIGSHVVRDAPRDWNLRALTRTELELTDFAAMRAAFQRDQPQLVIHCAAMSRTSACEANPELAWKNNVDVTRALCERSREIPLLFFSTDLVFDGCKGNYNEGDEPNPLTVYGETKIAAERITLANSQHTVIRTSLNAGATPRGNSSFDEQLCAAWARGETTRLFADEFRSPITAEVTAHAVWELVTANQPGLYHLGGSERLSRFEIGKLIAARRPQLNPRIEPSSIHDYAGPRRSPDTSLDCSKIQRLLSFPLPKLSEWLAIHPAALEA
jgi:dTDP-4-dehydrorhamnose reductase